MLERLRASRARYLVPNSITFLSLACGVAAILASAAGELRVAGALILLSYVLDLFDGELARRLQAGSSFGLQLDSLVDMVSLGTAPAILAFTYLQEHLKDSLVTWVLLWLLTILYTLAGAFRLARFNLLPIKKGQTESVGLTISTSGATLALAVITHLITGSSAPPVLFLALLFVLALLMASRIPHPSITWLFSYRWANMLFLGFFAVTLLLLRLPAVAVWFLFNVGYLGAALTRLVLRGQDEPA
jgi:CDP-diacylglycerol--serine O-phosphatidyltransferase